MSRGEVRRRGATAGEASDEGEGEYFEVHDRFPEYPETLIMAMKKTLNNP